MNWFQIFSYIKYKLTAKHKKGYGIHSPFLFEFINTILREKASFYNFTKIEAWRKSLENSKVKIEKMQYGAGSRYKSELSTISSIAKKSSIPPKYGKILYRIANRFNAENILEFGTSIGISTLYLSLHNSKAKVTTIEGCPNISTFAKESFKELNIVNITVINDDFDKILPQIINKEQHFDLIFFDGNHTKDATLKYFRTCLPTAKNNTIFIFDDIHWSKEMKEAWDEIILHPSITLSIDLFRLGIVLFRKESQKEHFIIRF